MFDPEFICMRCMSRLREPKGICPNCGLHNDTAENEEHQLACGSILAGAYMVGCALGQGGFGITYIGWDLNLGVKVAIKEYYPSGYVVRDVQSRTLVHPISGARSEMFQTGKANFVREAQMLAKFSGERSLAGVRTFFHENGTAYIVMDYIQGETLKDCAAHHGGRLPTNEVLDMFRPLCLSLTRVHACGLLHRDISPDNIIFRPDGTLALIDFGAARQMSVAGQNSVTVCVKNGFAPEEQYRTHGAQGPWTDVYALCATIYRLTTGVTPPHALDRLTNAVTLTPPNLLGAQFTPSQQNAILHGLKASAADRTRDMQQLYCELSQERKKKAEPENKPRNVWRSAAVVAIIMAALTCAALVLFLVRESAAKPAAETASVSAIETLSVPSAAATDTPAPSEEPRQESLPVTPAAPETPIPVQQQYSQGIIAAGQNFTVALVNDGTVVQIGGSGIHTDDWTDIVQLCADEFTAVGLRADGTVVVTGICDNGESDVATWTDIVQIECGYEHIVGLSSTGKVYFAGADTEETMNRSSCQGWSNIKVLIAGAEHLAGIRNDGTVVAVGYNEGGQCDTGSLRNVVSGDIGGQTTFCVHADGTVSALGVDFEGEDDVGSWTDIVAVAAASEHTVGLRADGTVVAVGSNRFGECDVEGWTDIVAVTAGGRHTVGVRSDGTLVATGSNSVGQCSVSGIKLW